MTFWLDAQLSPKLASLLSAKFNLPFTHIRDLGLLQAADMEIYTKARNKNVIIMTKDQDFKDLVLRLGSPPQVVWLTLGNGSTQILFSLLCKALPQAIIQLSAGEPLIQIAHL